VEIKEKVVSEAIIRTYEERLVAALESSVAIVGGGPAGLMAAIRLAAKGIKTTLFERRLSLGGGMWGGGIGRNVIVVQEEAKRLLEELGIKHKPFSAGYYVADSIESVCKLGAAAKDAGAEIFNLFSVEDVIARQGHVRGLVITRTPIEQAACMWIPLPSTVPTSLTPLDTRRKSPTLLPRKLARYARPAGVPKARKLCPPQKGKSLSWTIRARFIRASTWRVWPWERCSVGPAWALSSAACCSVASALPN